MRILSLLPLLFLPSACHHASTVYSVDGGMILSTPIERVDDVPLELARGDALRVRGPGNVAVEARAEGPYGLTATWKASGRDEAESRAILERYRLLVVRDGDTIEVRPEGTPLEVKDGLNHLRLAASLRIQARVPAGARVDVETSYGSASASGALGDVRIHSSYGAIDVAGVRGSVDAKTSSGAVKAADVEGASVVLASEYGSVSAERIAAESVRARTGSGAVRFAGLRAGAIDGSSGYGSVTATDIRGDAVLASGSGAIRIEGHEGALDARSGYGSVNAAGVFRALRLESGSGSVTAQARAGSRTDDGWRLVSGYGKVSLAVPDDFEGRLEAATGHGSITTRLARPLADAQTSRSSMRGVVGTSGGDVVLKSGSGSVTIESAPR